MAGQLWFVVCTHLNTFPSKNSQTVPPPAGNYEAFYSLQKSISPLEMVVTWLNKCGNLRFAISAKLWLCTLTVKGLISVIFQSVIDIF